MDSWKLKLEQECLPTGWDGWTASPTRWARVWASSGSWWWTGKPGMLQSMGSQRAEQNWATELMLMLRLQYFGHLMQRANSLEKTLRLGNNWRQKEKRAPEDEIVRWHHWFNGHEFEQTLGDSGGQRSLACYSSWGHKRSDKTRQRNNKKCF